MNGGHHVPGRVSEPRRWPIRMGQVGTRPRCDGGGQLSQVKPVKREG